MSREYRSVKDEILALEQKRAQYVLTSTLAVLFLAGVLFWSDSLAGPVLAPIILIGIGKGYIRFREHGRRQAELVKRAEAPTAQN